MALLAVLPLIQVVLLSFGISLLMSAATAKYRDLIHLNQFLIQIWMFATPIFYPLLAGAGEMVVDHLGESRFRPGGSVPHLPARCVAPSCTELVVSVVLTLVLLMVASPPSRR